MLLGDGHSQATIGKTLQMSRQAVWWRVKELVKMRVLEERPTWPRSYRILPEIAKNDKLEPIVLIHDLGFRMPILAIGPGYERVKDSLKSFWKENWWQRKVEYKYVKFDINETRTPNVYFHVTGAGRDKAAAVNNAIGKALEARDYIEKLLDMTLGDPDPAPYLANAHVLPIFMSKEQHDLLQGVWNDRSDPAALFEGNLVQTNTDALNTILKSHDTLQSELAELKKNAPPVDAITGKMDAFQKELTSLKDATTSMAAAILQINTTLQSQTEMNKAIKESLERLAQAY